MSQAQKRKRHQIRVKSGLSSGSSSLPPDDLDGQVSTTLTNSNSLNLPPVKKRWLSADKALVVLEVGIENVDIESISLGRRKRKM